MGRANKIEWKNIYYMLCYCVDELQYFNEGLINQEEISGTNDLLAQLLINSFEIIYRNGYIKKYREETMITDQPYGNIDIPESIRTGVYDKGKLVCHVSILDTNNKLNQIIKAAFTALIDSNKVIEDKINKKLMAQLYHYREMIKYVDNIKISYELLNDKISIPQWYRPIYSICKMILNDWLALDESGNTRLLELNNEDRLCHIWEKFLRNFIKTKYPMYRVSKTCLHESDGSVREPDIIIIDENNSKLLILDAKWYTSEKASKASRDKLAVDCAVSQNKNNFGTKYKITGLCVYASSRKCYIESTKETETNNIIYSDSFIAVNTDIKQLEEQIYWIIDQGFNLQHMKEIMYM